MFTSPVPVFVASVLLCALLSGCLGFTITPTPTLPQSGQAAVGAPVVGHSGVTQQGVPTSGTSRTYHSGQQTTGGSASWQRIVGGRYNGMYTNDMPVSSAAAGHQQTYANGQSAVNMYPGRQGQHGTQTNGERVSFTNGILNGVAPYQGSTGNVGLGTYPNGQPITSLAAYQQYLQLLRNNFARYPVTQTGVRTHTPTGRVGSYTNRQSQPAGTSHQSPLSRSSVSGAAVPGTSPLANMQTGMTQTNRQSQPAGASHQSPLARSSVTGTSPVANVRTGATQPRTLTGRNTQVQQTRTHAAASVGTTTLPPTPTGSAATAAPPTKSKSYNATRVATLLKALMAPAASLLPYAVVDPIPYGAALPAGQQAPLELVGPGQHPVPHPANTLTKLGRGMLSGPVQLSSPLVIPATAPRKPVDDPIYTPSSGYGVNLINGPHKSSLYGPLDLMPVNPPNTINPFPLALLGSLPALQPKKNIMMKLTDVTTSINAAKSLDCKTVASLKGRRGNSHDSCDDDACPGTLSCMMVYHVAFCCPQGVTYTMIQREAQSSMMNMYDN